MKHPLSVLEKVIPLERFADLFEEFNNYADLARHVSRVREDHKRISNRWQTYLPQLRDARRLVTQAINGTESLVKSYTQYDDGLKDYAYQEGIDYWQADNGNGLLRSQESQYLYALSRFFTNQHLYGLAKLTQQLLTTHFDLASELWLLVSNILDRLELPAQDYELDRKGASSRELVQCFRGAEEN